MITINTHSWNWAQWALLVWVALGLLNSAVMHGKPMVDADKQPFKFNFMARLTKDAILVAVMAAGGFFGGRS